jgi:ATP-dependent RNA helicase DeaD
MRDRKERTDRPERFERADRPARVERERRPRESEPGMQTYRIEVGHDHGVKPGNIVGAIANEANIDSKNIGRIEIYDGFSVLDLPSDLPKEVMQHLKTVWVAGQQLKISVDGQPAESAPAKAETRAKKEYPKAEKPAARVDAKLEHKVEQRVEVADVKAKPKKEKSNSKSKFAVQSYRIEVGRQHDITPSVIVATIAKEASLEPKHIGRIDIFDTHSVLDLPEGMPQNILDNLKAVKLAGQKLNIHHVGGGLINASAPASDKKKTAMKSAKIGRKSK